MNYHALFRIYGGHQFWGNADRQSLIREIVIPYVNKQIISVSYENDRALMNLGAATYLRILRTSNQILGGVAEALRIASNSANVCTDEVVAEARLTRASERARSVLQLAFVMPSPQVFVVMKIGDAELDTAYYEVIRPAIESAGYRAVRADDIPDSGPISDQVLEEIARSELVLCDLSGDRPNCYYETGFAHALGKETILTIRANEHPHFDLAGLRFVLWKTHEELRTGITERLMAFRARRTQPMQEG